MPKPQHEPQPDRDVWAVEGQFTQLIYSPKGEIEGLLIHTDSTPTQFVIDPHDIASARQVAKLQPGQSIVVEGSEAGPSPKGEAEHFVYHFERLGSIDGEDAAPEDEDAKVSGRVVRFNYARHGEANGVVLDSGDFVHTKPGGLAQLGLHIGDKVKAEGKARPLVTGSGRVIEARSVNGEPVGPAH